ncbi:unnamed protein product [Tilletia controversa]|uniref:Flavoprotein domain-containing protein n=2 Tax=Tilletia TaxID=13289 RepID=A0A177UK71_9BASI|nr:hypothetical protein CF336_g5170 [Tilletia laevis]KAE8258408.1 hypothetical protein A4X03_0g4390 [Tilletia caries]CAD6905782.1 unnamed protein product [Tilletia controversa]KAE8198870.1 hypothetical protein CF335_g4293 [Tilletia laevis]CAD6888909.1 unnamed protein product [Tilletia caries]
MPASQFPAQLPTSLRSPYGPLSDPPTAERPLHIVLACSGSVASVKVPLIVEKLLSYQHVMIHVVPTEHAMHFWPTSELKDRISPFIREVYGHVCESIDQPAGQPYGVRELAHENQVGRSTAFSEHTSGGDGTGSRSYGAFKLWQDADEWNEWRKVGDPVLHIELRRWADIVLLAPCDANTLAKLANGICDNLLTSFFRALSPSTATFIFPAMNTLMYEHPLTAQHLEVLRSTLGYEVHGPIPKQLACGDIGQGAMFEWSHIVDLVVSRFNLMSRNQ